MALSAGEDAQGGVVHETSFLMSSLLLDWSVAQPPDAWGAAWAEMGFYILQRPRVPTPAGHPGGAGEEASSSFVSGQKWPRRPEPVPRQRPCEQADSTMPRLLPARALPVPPAYRRPFSLQLSARLPLPALPSLFILPPPFL